MSIQSTSAAALHVLELLTGRTNWTIAPTGVNTFRLTHGGWHERMSITGQTLSTVETDPPFFVHQVAGMLQALDYVNGEPHHSVEETIDILEREHAERAQNTSIVDLPAGLTVSEDGDLLNWRGENYVRQALLQARDADLKWEREYHAEDNRALNARIAEDTKTIARLQQSLTTRNATISAQTTRLENVQEERKRVTAERDKAYAELERVTAELAELNATGVRPIHQVLEDGESQRAAEEYITEMRRAESVELVSAMTVGAGFELIRDIDGETAMWVQHLPSRPGVQIFLQVTHNQLVELSPAQLYVVIRDQVGAA